MKLFSVITVILSLLLVGCKEESLLKDLNQTQANEVVALLEKNNIRTTKKDTGKTGYVISVEKTDFATAVDLMTTYGLPSRARVDVAEMFPSDSLISSPRAEVARIYSAIEQRLEQTLNLMDGVVASRVHVSYDMNNVDAQKGGHPVHISALIRVAAQQADGASLIADAKRILVNSFSHVDYEKISVVLARAPEQAFYARTEREHAGFNTEMFFLVIASSLLIVGLAFAGYRISRKKRSDSQEGSQI
ncbi:type III secretion system inner membrane ring lipoprotein SctJ [Pantoea endophytica]|uniref:Lipoprotein n=1 Tax=Pantoea sp. BJ2 TaxID=3141322 RepID=A0AAU7U3F0_9GAMM